MEQGRGLASYRGSRLCRLQKGSHRLDTYCSDFLLILHCAAAMHRGWNKETDFVVSRELVVELAGMDELDARQHKRRERNRQSALAARIRRCGFSWLAKCLKDCSEPCERRERDRQSALAARTRPCGLEHRGPVLNIVWFCTIGSATASPRSCAPTSWTLGCNVLNITACFKSATA